MSTFVQLKSKIAQRLIDPSSTAVSLTNVGDAINDAITFWKYKRFWFNQTSVVKTMDFNDPYILQYGNTKTAYPLAPVLPSDFLYEIPENGFVINWNNLSYTMKKKHPKEFDATNVRGIGLPFIYTFRDENYEFYFYPNINYLMSVYYVKNYVDLVNDSDHNDFTDFAEKMIIYEALSRLSAELRQDEKMQAYYSAAALKEYENIKIRSFDQMKSGTLVIDTIL